MAVVDVRGRPLLLYVEGEPEEAGYLTDAMDAEGIRLVTRLPSGIPSMPRTCKYTMASLFLTFLQRT